MRLWLALLPLLAGCATTQNEYVGEIVPPDPANWGYAFYWAAHASTGSGLCDRELATEFLNGFERRFGPRYERLRERYREAYGPAPDFIVIPTCRYLTGTEQRARVKHRRAMSYFGEWLDLAEAQVEAQ